LRRMFARAAPLDVAAYPAISRQPPRDLTLSACRAIGRLARGAHAWSR
jgi:hypothetical protein